MLSQKPIHFDTLQPKKRSTVILLPENAPRQKFNPTFSVKNQATQDQSSPVYSNINAQLLKEAWDTIIGDVLVSGFSESRTSFDRYSTRNTPLLSRKMKLKFSDDRTMTYTYKQRTSILRRPEYITIQFIDIPQSSRSSPMEQGEDLYTSSMAIYYHCKYRFRDHSRDLQYNLGRLLECLNEEVSLLISDWNHW